MVMTLGDLISSSALIESLHTKGHYTMDYTLANKLFGNIYYNDKVVYYNSEYNILEFRMTMSTRTEKGYSGLHAIRMAVYGAKGTVYNSIEELMIKAAQKKARDYANDPNNSKKMRSKAKNMISHDILATEDGLSGGEYSGDKSTRTFADKGINTEQHKQAYLDDNTDAELYVQENLKGIVIPCATASEKFSQNYLPNGQVFYLEEPINLNSLVRVSCSCSSYHFTCAWYNNKSGAHLGPAPKGYQKRTDRSVTVLNVNKVPGLCKHLMLFSMLLINGGILDGMSEKDIKANNMALKNREEHLVVPKRLPENSTVLRRMLDKTDKQIREYQEQLSWYSGSRTDLAQWQHARRVSNLNQILKGNKDIRSVNQRAGIRAYNKEILYGPQSKTYQDMYNDIQNQLSKGYSNQHKGRQRKNKHI